MLQKCINKHSQHYYCICLNAMTYLRAFLMLGAGQQALDDIAENFSGLVQRQDDDDDRREETPRQGDDDPKGEVTFGEDATVAVAAASWQG